MRRFITALMILAVVVVLPAAADGSLAAQQQEQVTIDLTIDKAIELAVKNNRNYLISKEQVNQYKHRLRQNFGFLPNVSVQGAKILDEKLMEIEIPPFYPGGETTKATLDFTMDYEFTFQVVQPVFTGGKVLYSFKNAKLDLNIAREKRENARQDVILNIKKVFFNIQVMKELLKAHQEALGLAEASYRNIKENFELGMVSKYDLLRAELAIAAIKPNILNVEKILDLSILNLKFMTGIEEQVDINIPGELSYDKRTVDQARSIEEALVNRSEIRQLKMEKQKVGNLLKIAYGDFLPSLSLVGSYSIRSNTFSLNGSNWDNYYTISLGISYPIFTGLKRIGQVGEVKTLKRILALNLEELNDATRLQVRDLVMTLKSEYENIEAGLKNVETAKEGVRIAELNYNEGLISILELNASNNDLTRAKVAFFQAVYNYNIAQAQLEKLTGKTNITGEG